MRTRMEKGGPVVQTADEVDDNARKLASSTESLIQDSNDHDQLMPNLGSTVARDLNSTATSLDPAHLEHPSSVPAFKDPPADRVRVGYDFVPSTAAVSSDHDSSASPGNTSGHNHPNLPQVSNASSPSAASTISELHPLAPEAYGGGLYGHDDGDDATQWPSSTHASHVHSSDSQSAEGPPTTPPAHLHEPSSTGDRDLDITGQSYIQ